MYYLETNAIIKLGKKLKTIVKSVKCYTSFLTVLELLKNTSAQSYPGVRSRLKTIKDSGITIDWYSHLKRNSPGKIEKCTDQRQLKIPTNDN